MTKQGAPCQICERSPKETITNDVYLGEMYVDGDNPNYPTGVSIIMHLCDNCHAVLMMLMPPTAEVSR